MARFLDLRHELVWIDFDYVERSVVHWYCERWLEKLDGLGCVIDTHREVVPDRQ